MAISPERLCRKSGRWPIYVNGAEPGDTLAIHIHSQECDSQGYMGYWPWLFHLEDFFDQPCIIGRFATASSISATILQYRCDP